MVSIESTPLRPSGYPPGRSLGAKLLGVMAYYVQQHAREISIRLALGGSPGDVIRLIVGQGMKVVAIGVAVGLFAAAVLARWLTSLLFGVAPHDGSTFAAVAVALLGAALFACAFPARQALGVQPAVLMRAE